MAVADDLKAKVEEVRSAVDQAVVAIDDLRVKLEEAEGKAGVPEADVRAAIDSLDASRQRLVDAVTPAPEPIP